MTDVTADFEAGTLTNTIAATDPGSATAWDAVSIVAGGSAVYDNTHVSTGSTKSAKLSVGGTSGATYLQWIASFPDQAGTHYGRFYYYATANPAGDQIIFMGLDSTPASIWRLYHGSTANSGHLRIADATGSIKASGAVAIALNQWVRIEYKAIQSATVGQIECKLFNSPDSATPDDTFSTAANWNTGATCAGIDIGQISNTTNRTIWLDNIDVAAASYPGPVSSSPVNTVAPAVTGTAAVGSTLSCTTGTWTGDVSSGYAYQWKDASGNITGATSSTYVIGSGEAGKNIHCTVTATGTGGSASADSNTVGPVVTHYGPFTGNLAMVEDIVVEWSESSGLFLPTGDGILIPHSPQTILAP